MADADEIETIARELRVARAAIEGFARFLAERETDPVRRHCVEAILYSARSMKRPIEGLERPPDGTPSD